MEGAGFEPLRAASSMMLKAPLPPISRSSSEDKEMAHSMEGTTDLKDCKVVFVLGKSELFCSRTFH